MKFSLLIILFFLISCTTNNTNLKNIKTFNSTGFAYIYNEQINENNIIISKKVNNELLQIFHKDLRVGTLIKLINPKTKDTLVLINSKKIQYPDFYKIMITKPVAKKLNLDNQLPLIEVIVLKKNKSFIAKKAKIFKEEKKISSKAPVTSVKIANISKKPSKIKNNSKKIYILVASFYTNEAANLLKQRIITETPHYNIKKLIIRKKSNKEFEVLSGPYKSINLLKNDYSNLKIFGFEELDIFINE
jgi:hypothetical protein